MPLFKPRWSGSTACTFKHLYFEIITDSQECTGRVQGVPCTFTQLTFCTSCLSWGRRAPIYSFCRWTEAWAASFRADCPEHSISYSVILLLYRKSQKLLKLLRKGRISAKMNSFHSIANFVPVGFLRLQLFLVFCFLPTWISVPVPLITHINSSQRVSITFL